MKREKIKKQFVILLAGILMLVVSGQVTAVTKYTIKDIGTLGGPLAHAGGINNSGQVVGISSTAGNSACHAFLYDGTTMHDLASAVDGEDFSHAWCINDGGQIVGSNMHGLFLYDGTNMTYLKESGRNVNYFVAKEINNNGQVAGYIGDYSYGNRAFFYDGTTMNDLGALFSGESEATGINDSGMITVKNGFPGWLYDGTNKKLLSSGGFEMSAIGINNNGLVLGAGRTVGNSNLGYHAFIYDTNTDIMKDLGTLTRISHHA